MYEATMIPNGSITVIAGCVNVTYGHISSKVHVRLHDRVSISYDVMTYLWCSVKTDVQIPL